MIRPLWIDVDLKALRDNCREVKKHVGKKVKIIATIKQSAYGHGMIPVARELERVGINFFGLGDIEEALVLREDGFSGSIIILSAVLDEFIPYFLNYNLIPTVVDLNFAKKLNFQAAKKGKVVSVHIKIDTGMGRFGVCQNNAESFVRTLSKFKNLFLEGIYTHFPVADTDAEFTNKQIEIFNFFIKKLEKEKIVFKYRHCANSMGLINYKKAHFNMVRPGLVLYGVKPIDSKGLKVKPILSLKSKVIFIKKVASGRSISYGRTYISDKPTTIATIAVGYADGYPWSLSNRAKVIINGKLYNITGRVCMDHIMVDLGQNSNIKVGQEVVLIGRSKNTQITAQSLAKAAKTIPYEILSCLSLHIPRKYKSFLSK